MRDAAGILDLPGFSRFHVAGRRSRGLAPHPSSPAHSPRVGRVGLVYFADERGRIVTEMSVTRLGEDEMLLITAAAAEWHDRDWLLGAPPRRLVHRDREPDREPSPARSSPVRARATSSAR